MDPAARRGFTLVEVLVALLVMAIMAVMAWQGVDGIVRARNASQARLEQTLRLNTVIAQWDRDLAMAQDSGALKEAIACDGSTLRLTRRAPGGIQVVVWSLRPEGILERWAGPAVKTAGELQDSWFRSLQLQGNETGNLRTLTGVSAWQIYFFYQGQVTWSNCQSTGNKPTGVRVVLSFAPGSGFTGDLTRDVQVGR